MHFVELARLCNCQVNALLGNDAQASGFNFALIAPVKLRRVASGLMIENVRWIAMIDPLQVLSCGSDLART